MHGLWRDVFPRQTRGIHAAGWYPMIFYARVSNTLADAGEGINKSPVEEYAMMLEVMMADRLGWLHPPAFSWNARMVMHILKSDLVLGELEHVQVDGLGTAYLFFYDK